jgi:hypothetical protein
MTSTTVSTSPASALAALEAKPVTLEVIQRIEKSAGKLCVQPTWLSAQVIRIAVEREKIKSRDIATHLGLAKSKVSNRLKAARLFKSCPAGDDIAKFMAIFHGNSPQTQRGKKGNPMTVEQALAASISFAKKAVKLGMDGADVIAAITEALEVLPEADSEE